MKGLEGKVAIVTGSARGIGKSIATELASYNVKVVVADILEDLAKKTSNELNERGYETCAYNVDLQSMDEGKKLVDFTLGAYGTIDILVNCAGIQIRRASANFEEAEWDLINDINLKAPFFLSQAAGKVMLEKGQGSIIMISSATATRYTSRRVPYNVTKAAISALAGALGNEWARFGVRVNAVAPGWLNTEMVRDGLKMGIIKEEEILPMIPANRFMEPPEVAQTVCFLASDEASGVVGQTIYVDGGVSLRCIPEPNNFTYDQNG